MASLYQQNEYVKIFNLGNDKEYLAKVVGHSVNEEENLMGFYVVELIDKIPDYVWTHLNLPCSCIKKYGPSNS